MVYWLHNITLWYEYGWSFAGIICFLNRHYRDMGWLAKVGSRFISETKPFYFIFIGGYYVTLSLMGKFHWYTSFGILIDVYAYYLIKRLGDDDDHWKRRIEKLSQKVEVTEGKLVVVPTN